VIDVLVPCLGRPESIARLKANHAQTSTLESQLVFIVSPHDSAVASECVSENVRFLLMDRRHSRGDYAKKMNHAFSETTAPWLLLGAQDIHFHPGWDIAALNCASQSGKRVIGTNDLGNRESYRTGSFSTHPLVARSYVEEHGTIDDDGLVSEAYDHNWVDRELAETAAYRHEWLFCKRSVVEHMHPHWGKGLSDETYRKGMRNFGRDRAIYMSRRPLWGQPGRVVRKRTGGRVRG
jgi:hypothetical protein